MFYFESRCGTDSAIFELLGKLIKNKEFQLRQELLVWVSSLQNFLQVTNVLFV